MGVRPIQGLCPVCNGTFDYPIREQGGGRRPIYCSGKCRSLDWVHHNAGKRQASVIKYDERPENKAAKRKRERKRGLAKHYGWTETDLQVELIRQQFSCAGCLAPISEDTARVDHNHETQQVRGLLCNSCNWALGHIKDARATLHRLSAYLDRDRTKISVYLIGALKNSRIPEIGNLLRNEDYDVMDEWFTPGPEADTNWQAYERIRGRSYAEALKGRAATNIFFFDRSYIDLSDFVVLVMPAGKSAMLELGYARGRGKKTFVFLDGAEPDRYDIMTKFSDGVFKTADELLTALKLRGGGNG